jgi:hypothetical protein
MRFCSALQKGYGCGRCNGQTIERLADKIAALSGALLVLGIVYWLMRERDDARA